MGGTLGPMELSHRSFLKQISGQVAGRGKDRLALEQPAHPLYVVAGLTYHTHEHLHVCGWRRARLYRVTVDSHGQ
jgi:hypothetical protein